MPYNKCHQDIDHYLHCIKQQLSFREYQLKKQLYDAIDSAVYEFQFHYHKLLGFLAMEVHRVIRRDFRNYRRKIERRLNQDLLSSSSSCNSLTLQKLPGSSTSGNLLLNFHQNPSSVTTEKVVHLEPMFLVSTSCLNPQVDMQFVMLPGRTIVTREENTKELTLPETSILPEPTSSEESILEESISSKESIPPEVSISPKGESISRVRSTSPEKSISPKGESILLVSSTSPEESISSVRSTLPELSISESIISQEDSTIAEGSVLMNNSNVTNTEVAKQRETHEIILQNKKEKVILIEDQSESKRRTTSYTPCVQVQLHNRFCLLDSKDDDGGLAEEQEESKTDVMEQSNDNKDKRVLVASKKKKLKKKDSRRQKNNKQQRLTLVDKQKNIEFNFSEPTPFLFHRFSGDSKQQKQEDDVEDVEVFLMILGWWSGTFHENIVLTFRKMNDYVQKAKTYILSTLTLLKDLDGIKTFKNGVALLEECIKELDAENSSPDRNPRPWIDKIDETNLSLSTWSSYYNQRTKFFNCLMLLYSHLITSMYFDQTNTIMSQPEKRLLTLHLRYMKFELGVFVQRVGIRLAKKRKSLQLLLLQRKRYYMLLQEIQSRCGENRKQKSFKLTKYLQTLMTHRNSKCFIPDGCTCENTSCLAYRVHGLLGSRLRSRPLQDTSMEAAILIRKC